MSDTTAATPVVDFAAIKNGLGEEYAHPFQVLDENAKVVDQAVLDSYSDDELVHFMEIMLYERVLHEQTTVFSKAGPPRLLRPHPRAGGQPDGQRHRVPAAGLPLPQLP
jgi:hypothetical protein